MATTKTIQELQDKLAKAAEKVASAEKSVARYQQKLANLEQSGASDVSLEFATSDLKYAKQKLADLVKIRKNWETKLFEARQAEDFLKNAVPEIIKSFMESWKVKAVDFYKGHYEAYLKFHQDLKNQEREARIYCIENFEEYTRYRQANKDYSDYDLINALPRGPMSSYLDEKHLSRNQINSRCYEFAGTIVNHMSEIHDAEKRNAWLERHIELEKNAKMLDLLKRITAVVGSIQDVNGLHIGPTGGIEGIIAGSVGKAKIETISAGGWNIQCFHFRTLVHKYEEHCE